MDSKITTRFLIAVNGRPETEAVCDVKEQSSVVAAHRSLRNLRSGQSKYRRLKIRSSAAITSKEKPASKKEWAEELMLMMERLLGRPEAETARDVVLHLDRRLLQVCYDMITASNAHHYSNTASVENSRRRSGPGGAAAGNFGVYLERLICIVAGHGSVILAIVLPLVTIPAVLIGQITRELRRRYIYIYIYRCGDFHVAID